MGTVTAQEIVTKVATLLFDANNIKWSQTEILGWLTDAQRATIALMPESASTIDVIQMTPGIRQTIPAGGWMLLDITRNMGTDGATAGRAVKRSDRAVLDETNPNWYGDPPATTATMYMYNIRDRVSFYVYPPSDGTGYLEVNYAAEPAEITNPAATIAIDNIYVPALVDYVMWRAKSKMVPFAGDPKDAQAYFDSWSMFVVGEGKSAATLASQMGGLKASPPQGQGSQG